MKKVLLTLSAVVAMGTWANAQDATKAQSTISKDNSEPKLLGVDQNIRQSPEAVIYTEDFSGGIPSSWTNQGYLEDAQGNLVPSAAASWEFRGPNTTPDNTTGSRGAYTTGSVINSQTPNDWVIFDSDYLDNGGTPGAFGAGAAPAPHFGTLETGDIDLTGHPNVELVFNTYARKFVGDLEVAISNDGGVTWVDTVEVLAAVGTNAQTPLDEVVSVNISQVGGSANARIMFIFDGGSANNANTNGDGYYFWQLDDVVVRDLPANELQFTQALSTAGNTVAREVRIITNPTGGKWTPVYGTVPLEQVYPMAFSGNMFNYGFGTQYNARMEVEVTDLSTSSTVATLTTPGFTIQNNEEVLVDTLITNGSWTPADSGEYEITFTLVSDSISAAEGPSRSVELTVTGKDYAGHQYSADFGNLDNYMGTDNGVLSMASAMCFPNSDPDSSGYIGMWSASVFFGPDTDAGGTVLLSVYDSAGVDIPGSGPQSPIYSNAFQLDASVKGAFKEFDLTDPNTGYPLILPSNSCYYVAVSFLTSDADSVIEIGNDQTIEADGDIDRVGYGVVMEFDDNTWYTGFLNSLTVNAPLIRANYALLKGIGLEDYAKQNALSVYPNPTVDGQVKLDIDLGGQFTLDVVSVTGQLVHSEELSLNGGETLNRDFSNLAKGTYIVKLRGSDFQSTEKLTIK